MEIKTLLIDEEHTQLMNDSDYKEQLSLLVDFLKDYKEKSPQQTDLEWLTEKYNSHMGNILSDEEITTAAKNTISSIDSYRNVREEMEHECSRGRTKEDVFADHIVASTKNMSTEEVSSYMNILDESVNQANDSLLDTITKKDGSVSLNPNLDGFLAEDLHAQSFNMNAASNGSNYRARVVKPNGSAYEKNGVDIEIYDLRTGEVVKKYQAKYYNSAKNTDKAFNKGNYEGQNKLAPSDQASEINNAEDCISAPDGTKSDPLSKADAKDAQHQAQNNGDISKDWNDYKVRDIAIQVGKKAAIAGAISATIGTGMDIAVKYICDEEISFEDEAKVFLETGATAGSTVAVAGSLYTALKLKKLKVPKIPLLNEAESCVGLAITAVENVKTLHKISKSECSFEEGINEIEKTTLSVLGGFIGTAKGSVKGTAIGKVVGGFVGTICGPVGAKVCSVVGGFIGGFVGQVMGSNLGEAIVKTKNELKNHVNALLETGSKAVSKVTDKIFA